MANINQRRGRLLATLVLILGTAVAVFVPTDANHVAHAQGNENCILTADLLDGDGLSLGGAGRSFSGSGRSFSGSGRSFSGSGRSFSGSGRSFSGSGRSFSGSAATLEEFLDLLEDNQVDFQNLLDFVDPIVAAEAFNPERSVAIIVLDNDNHGALVLDILQQYDNLIDAGAVGIHFIPINGEDGNDPDGYSLDNVNTLLTAKINELTASGVHDIIVNMSFVIVPCEDVVTVDGAEVEINVKQIAEEVADNNDFTDIDGILECVVDNHDGTLTAHFGYENPNKTSVYVPLSDENKLTGGGLSAEQLRAATPKYFANPGLIEGREGRSDFFPNSAFQVRFHEGSELVWTLFGRTETASNNSIRCFDADDEHYHEGLDDDIDDIDDIAEHEEDLDVIIRPILECVSEIVDDEENVSYLAHFGYQIDPINVEDESFEYIPYILRIGDQTRLSGGGLSNAEKDTVTPFYFNAPEVIPNRDGRTQFYPNSAFQIEFDGSNLVWTLLGRTSTASAGSTRCATDLGADATSVLADQNGISEEDAETAIARLIDKSGDLDNSNENADVIAFRDFLQAEVNRTDISFIPVASAGNNARLFQEIGASTRPSAPAIFPSVVAVSGSFVEPPSKVADVEAQWEDSQDGEIMTQAGAYVLSGTDNAFIIGTSFAAPMVTRIYAAYSGIPNACVDIELSEGVFAPPVAPFARASNPDDAASYSNTAVIAGEASPFNCFIPEPQVAPECNGMVATIWVDETDTIRSTNASQDGDPYVAGTTTLIGTNGDDVIVGTDLADRIRGRSGNDTICGLRGNDNINGQNGNDTIFGGSTDMGNDPSDNDTISGGPGEDTIFGGNGADMLRGGDDRDVIRAGSGDDTIRGGDGNDLLVGQNGIDNMRGGEGNDNMFGEAMADTMRGDAGDDTISGQGGDDDMRGGPGMDVIYGGFPNNPATNTGNDTIRGGDDNDTAFGGDGDDDIRGGNGNDSLIGGSTELAVDPSGVDNIRGEAGDDTIRGGDGNDMLRGGADNDRIFGGINNDNIRGDGGNDFLDGDTGDDDIRGGDGDDSLFGEPGNDVLRGEQGNDLLNGQAGDDTIRGGAGDDELYGGLRANWQNGNDVDTGNDHMRGGEGNDSLFGADGDDQLRGEENDDRLNGGANTDVCRGGTGVDTFIDCETERDPDPASEPVAPEGE